MKSIYIQKDDYKLILSTVLRNYLKNDKSLNFENAPEKITYTTLVWVIELANYYRSLVDFVNPLEGEKCSELVIKSINFFDAAKKSRHCNIFGAFTRAKSTKRNYLERKYFTLCDTLKVVLARTPKNGTGE